MAGYIGNQAQIRSGLSATIDELNIIDGVTATTAELNILDGVTSTATELNILDGVTATTAELNIMDGVTATTAELNIMDGVTATAAEINLIDGGTSRGTTAVADGDGFLTNDGGTMRMTNVTTLATYMGTKITGGSMVYLTSSGVVSDVASVAFTQFDATKYDHYQFWFQNVIPVTDDVQLHGFTSSDEGNSYDTGASDYRTHDVDEGTSVAFGYLLSGLGNVGSASGEMGCNSIITVASPHLTTFTTVNADGGSFVRSSGRTLGTAYYAAGFTRRSAADVDAIKFAFSSGNIESGEIVMYGIANGT
jgi:hypothetical protein